MQVSDITKNGRYMNSTYSSMIPLIRFLKIFALNYKVEPTFKSSSILIKSLCTCLILGLIVSYCIYYKIRHVYILLDLSIQVTDMVQIISDYCQYIVDLCMIYKYGRNMSVKYFKQYEKIDRYLKVVSYSLIKRRLMKSMAFLITIWIVSSFSDFGAWLANYGWMIPTAHSISYLFLFIKILTIIDLIAHAINIEVRLKIISIMVENCYSSIDIRPRDELLDCAPNINWLYCNADPNIHNMKAFSNDHYEFKRLSKCYLLLTEQVAFINKLYGFRILLNTLSLLLDMVKVTNLTIRFLIITQKTNTDFYTYLPGLTGSLRLLTCTVIIIALVHQCEQAYRQKEQIINAIDHLLVNKNPGNDLRSAILDLRGLLQERPIQFNMANFFILNYSLLMSITSVVITYTIILLQSVTIPES